MESGLHGVPLSASQMAPMAVPLTSGIRAPLTIDESDFEYSVSSKSRRNSIASSYYSNSELESEGFVSGEDESETRPYVTGQDEKILEETHFCHEYGFYKPSVVKQNGEIVQENSIRNGNVFSWPSVGNPDEKIAQESGNVNRNAFFRSFVGNPDEEFTRESGNVYVNSFLRAFVGNPDERTCKVISNVNGSDDSRSFLSESGDEFVESENYGLNNSGSRPLVAVIDEEMNLENGPTKIMDIIKVPVVQRLHIPIAKISRDSDDDDSQSSDVLEGEGFLDIVRVPSFEILSRLDSVPKVRMSEADEGYDNELQAENMVEMEFVKDLLINNCVLGPKDENEHIDVEDVIKCVISSNTVQDRGPDVNEKDKANSLSVNEQYNLDEEIQEIDVTDDQKKCLDLVDCSNTDLDDNFVFNQDVETEKLETEREQEIKDMPPEFPGLPEALTENMPVNMSDSHLGDASPTGSDDCQSVFKITKLDQETTKEAENSGKLPGEVKSLTFFTDTKAMVVETGQYPIAHSHEEILFDHSKEIDCQIITDSDEPHSVDGVYNFSLESDSVDFVSMFVSSRPNIEARNRYLFLPPSTNFELKEALTEGEKKKKLERIQQIRVKYLWLVHQLGRSPEDSIASKVLRQLSIAEAKYWSQTFFLDSTRNAAVELEAREKGELDFSLCILIIGKTGVGKSATINSIFGENKTMYNAFEPSTIRVKEINGNIDGVKIKVFDTPGLRTSHIDQSVNRKILSSIKKLMRKFPPDVILYVDRLDTQFSNLNDLPLLKSVTSCLGSSIWQKSIIAFTHANLVPPDGLDGYPLSYEEFIAEQSRAVQQLISQSAGEPLVMNGESMIPASLVENHQFANGEMWKLNLMFLCYSMKILSEVSYVVKIDNPLDPLKLFLRCRFVEPSYRILTRPFFESYHDCGYDGVLTEDNLDIRRRLAAVFSVQLTKDKKEFDIQLRSTMGGLDNQTFGKNKKLSYMRKCDLNINVRVGLNKKLSGKISVKKGGLDQLQIAALAFFPIAKAVFDRIFRQSAED